jgi:hypothetical protein
MKKNGGRKSRETVSLSWQTTACNFENVPVMSKIVFFSIKINMSLFDLLEKSAL